MKKVLFIAHRIPYPPNKGEKIRAYNIIKYLAARHMEVHCVTVVDSKSDLPYARQMNFPCASFGYAFFNRRLKKAICLSSLLLKRPVSLCYFYSRSLQRYIDRRILALQPDYIFCSSSPTAEYVFRSRALQGTLKPPGLLMDLIDVDSRKWLEYAEKIHSPLKIIYSLEGRLLGRYEKKIIQRFHHVFLVSEAEVGLLGRDYPNVYAMGNGVDMDFFYPSYRPRIAHPKGPNLVFTGAMDYYPNVDGVTWFAEEVFPWVRREFPHCTFYIVGGNPVKRVRDLSKREGIVVTGFVEDVRDYLAVADICVAPLRIARGIQNKVLEAMSMGRPVVTTPQGAEGIGASVGEEIMVAGDAGEIAGCIVELLRDRDRRRIMGEKARRRIENDYTWENRLGILMKVLGA